MNYKVSLKPRLAALILRKYIDMYFSMVSTGYSNIPVDSLSLTLESTEVTHLFEEYSKQHEDYDYKKKVKAAITAASEGNAMDVVFRDLDLYSEYDLTMIRLTHYSHALSNLNNVVEQYNEFYGL